MANNGQLTVAWEMLSSVVMLRAKAREQKFPKLLSSLHGVEVELARIIAGSDANSDKSGPLSLIEDDQESTWETAGSTTTQTKAAQAKKPATDDPTAGKGRARQREDRQLKNNTRKYLALARQLRDMVSRGEVAAFGLGRPDAFDGDGSDAHSDDLMGEQHELSQTIARLRASTAEGLVDKAKVLDDLVEEGTDDPVLTLARSLARDVIAMNESRATN